MGADRGSAQPDRIKADISRVDSDFVKANTKTSWDWPTVGFDYAETRFSKLDQINTGNVKELGLVRSYNLESSRGIVVISQGGHGTTTRSLINGLPQLIDRSGLVDEMEAIAALGRAARQQPKKRPLRKSA